jgi:hypothetical protein
VVKARIVITGAMLAAAVAGCSSTPTSTITQFARGETSYQNGVKGGESISLPNETAAQMRNNCAASVLRKMPRAGIKSQWMSGCEAGIIQAGIRAGDSG